MTALHADALATLRAWVAPTPDQERLRRAYLTHLEGHPDGLDRSCRPAHVTAGALVVSEDRRRVLLTLHAKAQSWFHTGGHCESGDRTLVGAARREAEEESGVAGLHVDPVPVHLDRHRVEFCHPEGPVDHLDVRFVAVAPDGAEHAVSAESLDVRWWPVDELPATGDLPALVGAALRRLQSTSPAAI